MAKNILKLVKMGCDFRADEQRGSDCKNYRLRVDNIKTKDNKKIGADFGFWGDYGFLRCEAWQVVNNKKYSCFVSYPLLEALASNKFYKTADILEIINKISSKQYDDVLIIER